MGKKFNNVDSYAGSPAQIWAMLSDQAYWEGKYSSLGASNLQWKTFNASETALTVSSVREVAANLPAAAKKVIGETAEVTQTEEWTKSGDELACTITITTKGAPGGTDGTMSVKADGAGSTWSADFDIKVSIPLLGKKLEGIMLDETGENFVKEKAFNDEWLASH
ncbi:MAG: DUF2505 domain-containing protein [Candidatus Nanopelagicales bacterium]